MEGYRTIFKNEKIMEYTPAPWETRNGTEIHSTHKRRGWNREIGRFKNQSDAVTATESVNALKGIKNPVKWVGSVRATYEKFSEFLKDRPDFNPSDSKSDFILNLAKERDEIVSILKELDDKIKPINLIQNDPVYQKLRKFIK
jgi:hypothetical protein